MRPTGPLLALVVLALGCGSTDEAARYYAKRKYPERAPEDVEVLSKKPDRPHEVIADFQATGLSVQRMRKKAARVGAHAVIIVTLGGPRSESEEWAGEDRYAGTYTRITATAIRWRDVQE